MISLQSSMVSRSPGRAFWRAGLQTPDSYMKLVRKFPLIPICSEKQYDAALAVVDRLAVRGESSLDRGEAAYLAALTQFVRDYEQDRHIISAEPMSPLEMLRHLMKQAGLSTADLGRIIGNRSLASQILLGKRSISKANIRKIADYFRIAPGLFLQ